MFASQDAPTPAWFERLNEPQRTVAEHDGAALLVIAGAGTGKTAAVVGRLARLLANGVPPDRVLLLTFSRRAAKEMIGRAGNLVGAAHARHVWGGTFHAIAHRLLRMYGAAVGLDTGFTVLDEGDAADLMGAVRTDLGYAERGRRFPRKEVLLDMWSRVANAQEALSEVVEQRYAWCKVDPDDIRALFAAYLERKSELHVLDFDDLLLYWRALTTTEAVGSLLRDRFDHVLVDEYQDTNAIQADILQGLRPTGDGLCAVGDDAQAIYGFRAASAASMTDYTERFANTTVVALEQNYRSTEPILAMANGLIAEAPTLFPKKLWTDRTGGDRPLVVTCADESSEAAWVADAVLAAFERGVSLREQAVLVRAAHHTMRLELELLQRNIPFRKYGGLRFLEAAHVKDLVALLRVVDNPSDELAWRRCLGMLDGVGPALTRRILEYLNLPDPNAVARLGDAITAVALPAPSVSGIAALCSALTDCGGDPEPPPAGQVERLVLLCRPLLERKYGDASARLADLEQLGGLAGEHKARCDFLAELTLDPPIATGDLAGHPHIDDDWLNLSTVHSAKGLEWTNVFVIHASDGNFPSDLALREPEGLEEERRLFYVALTRARDQLHVTFPLRYYRFPTRMDDQHLYGQPSRFLRTLGDVTDRAFAGCDEHDNGATTVEPGADPVGNQLAALWAR